MKLAYTPRELQAVLPIGRHRALALAREIGIQVSPRRWLVSRARLEQWLADADDTDGEP